MPFMQSQEFIFPPVTCHHALAVNTLVEMVLAVQMNGGFLK